MKKILVVDDDEDILHLLKGGLLFEGFGVRACTTYQEFLEMLEAFGPDLVIIDVSLGDADGREVCLAIKSQAAYANIPILLISGNPENLASWKDVGAFATVEKPFDFPALMLFINLALG